MGQTTIDSIDYVTGIGNGAFNAFHLCCAGSIQDGPFLHKHTDTKTCQFTLCRNVPSLKQLYIGVIS